MGLRITNTLTGTKEEFKPLEPGIVKVYVCGPTVYDYTHIGHARTYVAFDAIVRYLKYKGYKVKYIVNITDIDDKIIRKARELGVSIEEVARKYEADFFEVCRKLNLIPADLYPRATEHIEDMIKIIERLVEKGYAYVSGGDVYFDVSKFEDYGKLSKQSIEELKAGARVEVSEKKRNPLDFALWKAAKEGEPSWPSPWGRGRPGWHIECTAMSMKYLGEQIDIHGGGEDLIFPHHENEIAQSEAYTGKKPFVKYWLHTGLLMVKKQKMSKSLGNIITVREFLSHYHPDVLRLLILSSHYRSQIEYSGEKVEQMASSLSRLYGTLEKLRLMSFDEDLPEKGGKVDAEIVDKVKQLEEKFTEAMDDDFHTPRAISAIFEFIGFIEKVINQPKPEVSREACKLAYSKVKELLEVLGFKPPTIFGDSSFVKLLKIMLTVREEARKQKMWSIADQIRAKLRELGILLEDRREGTVWHVLYKEVKYEKK